MAAGDFSRVPRRHRGYVRIMARIGTSDLEIFPLALGANTFGWTSDETTSFAVLDAFVAGGGTHIDTADGYSAFVEGNSGGESETIIGNWLAKGGDRDAVSIATKVSSHPEYPGLSAGNVARAVDASLARLQTDRIDLYYAHHDDEDAPLAETVAAFEELVAAGKIRHVAVSNYSPERLREWMTHVADQGATPPVALQPHYNLLHRTQYEAEYAPLAEQHGWGVLPYFGLASGVLTGKYTEAGQLAGTDRERIVRSYGYLRDDTFTIVGALTAAAGDLGVAPATLALAWLRTRPQVVAPIASARTVDQLGPLLAAATLDVPADVLARLDEVSASI